MDSKILARLRKMVAHERSARAIGSISEAEAFAAKIQEIMDEHNLGMTDVEYAEREANEPIDWADVDESDEGFRPSRFMVAWQLRLARAIAACNNCRLIRNSGVTQKNGVSFVGRTTNREAAKMMYLYFMDLAYHLNDISAEQARGEKKFWYVNSLEPWQDYDINAFYKIMRAWKDAWFVGFAESLSKRFYAKAAEMNAKAKQSEAGQNALVHIKKDELAINDWLKGKTHNVRGSGRVGGFDAHGFARGRSQGAAVALTSSTMRSGRVSADRLLS